MTTQPGLHEQVLVDGLREGNLKIFDYLFHYYYSGLVVFAFRYTGSMQAAEDLVQDFFFHLWLNREKTVIRQSLKSYFFSAVKNKSLDFLKHQKIEKKAETKLKFFQEDPAEEQQFMVESELEEQVNRALAKLPEKCRKIFMMNRFEGLKPDQIAEMENISVRTVEGHIGKAIRILRMELKPHFPDFMIMLFLRNLHCL
ncbi:MAG: RNA polymerase sigma-70 factor [Prolixibacteraceae bacterium]